MQKLVAILALSIPLVSCSATRPMSASALSTPPTSTPTDHYADAWSAYERGNKAKAFLLWRVLGEEGDVRSQFNLGVLYQNGEGVKQDYLLAAKWYKKAAEQDDAPAQYHLGLLYEIGDDSGIDPGIFVHILHRDDFAAAEWYRKSAEQGYAPAQHNLGTMYRDGRGVSQDYVQAYKWFDLAASRYPPSTDEYRKDVIRRREEVASIMTPAQIAEAQRKAREWKPKKEH